jgi:hypothetical protein
VVDPILDYPPIVASNGLAVSDSWLAMPLFGIAMTHTGYRLWQPSVAACRSRIVKRRFA